MNTELVHHLNRSLKWLAIAVPLVALVVWYVTSGVGLDAVLEINEKPTPVREGEMTLYQVGSGDISRLNDRMVKIIFEAGDQELQISGDVDPQDTSKSADERRKEGHKKRGTYGAQKVSELLAEFGPAFKTAKVDSLGHVRIHARPLQTYAIHFRGRLDGETVEWIRFRTLYWRLDFPRDDTPFPIFDPTFRYH